MDAIEQFQKDCKREIAAQAKDKKLSKATQNWRYLARPYKYGYHFTWLGRPIIQYPQDILAMQEIIWNVQPDLIIETGIAHGGSLILSASMLELNAACGGPEDGEVLGIDIDIRPHNRKAIEVNPLYKRIHLLEGSSIAPPIIDQVHEKSQGKDKILVFLDSNHTHEHVLAELEAYAPLVSIGSYCVVFDTIIEEMPEDAFPDRPWGKDNNPKTAVRAFLRKNIHFEVDRNLQNKLLITVAPEGFLRRTE